jgi:hypothetical protein
MAQASSILDSAEALSSKYPDYNYNKPVLLRERAAFYYASGQCDDAVKAAAKVYGLSKEHSHFASEQSTAIVSRLWHSFVWGTRRKPNSSRRTLQSRFRKM